MQSVSVLNGRSRIFCCEKDALAALKEIPQHSFTARDGLKVIEDVHDFALLNPDSSFFISFRLRGGKGGFGTLLRSFRINKSTNQNMCRDLNGRRLVDVKEEEKLKKWIEKAAEREREKEAKLKARHEKLKAGALGEFKHDFDDPDYIKRREEILEKTEDAFEAVKFEEPCLSIEGFEHLKRKKKRKMVVEEEKSSSDSEDPDRPGTSAISAKRRKKTKGQKEDSSKSKEEIGGKRADESPEEMSSEDSISGSETGTNTGAKITKDFVSKGEEKETPAPHTVTTGSTVTKKAQDHSFVTSEVPKEFSERKENQVQDEQQVKDRIRRLPRSESARSIQIFNSFAKPLVNYDLSTWQVDLSEVNDVSELEQLGIHHLKDALEKRSLKCGGTLQERAARLFSVKGLTPEKFPKNILAPKKKK